MRCHFVTRAEMRFTRKDELNMFLQLLYGGTTCGEWEDGRTTWSPCSPLLSRYMFPTFRTRFIPSSCGCVYHRISNKLECVGRQPISGRREYGFVAYSR